MITKVSCLPFWMHFWSSNLECFWKSETRERRTFAFVNALMLPQIRQMSEPLLTTLARERSLTAMNPLVPFQSGPLRESLLTQFAHERPLSGMNALMVLQVRCIPKSFATKPTHLGFFIKLSWFRNSTKWSVVVIVSTIVEHWHVLGRKLTSSIRMRKVRLNGIAGGASIISKLDIDGVAPQSWSVLFWAKNRDRMTKLECEQENYFCESLHLVTTKFNTTKQPYILLMIKSLSSN